jgi:uncharacterized protein (DUF3084 family)
MKEILKAPKHVYTGIDSQITSLQESMKSAKEASYKATKHLKAEYESNLEAQVQNNTRVKKQNKKLRSEIEDLQTNNAALRKKADHTLNVNTILSKDVEAMKGNLSYAMEFASMTLDNATASMDMNSTDLSVLVELAESDKVTDHVKRVAGIESKMMAALQMGDRSRPKRGVDTVDAKEVLSSLLKSISDLSEQQNASETALTEEYEMQFGRLVQEYEVLEKEQVELNATKAHEEEIGARLQTAVKRLTATREQLTTRDEALRKFSKRLGNREMPVHSHGHDHNSSNSTNL